MKKKFKIKWNNISLVFLLIITVSVLIYSLINIFQWFTNGQDTKEQVEEVKEKVEIKEENPEEETIVEPTIPPKSDNPYWEYIKMNFIDADLTELIKTNSDTVGWIELRGTDINLPFVQTTNNEFYLENSFDKKPNKAGWIFADYRNDFTNLDKNNIIYGHNRVDKTMFNSLHHVLSDGWYRYKGDHIIRMSTKTTNTVWQVISVYCIPTTTDYLKTSFSTDEEFLEFGKMIMDRSIHKFDTSLDKNDKIITLSTCFRSNKRTVLHAKLIKLTKKN